jgi:hypothetical protein
MCDRNRRAAHGTAGNYCEKDIIELYCGGRQAAASRYRILGAEGSKMATLRDRSLDGSGVLIS